jgi:hypothetical protein
VAVATHDGAPPGKSAGVSPSGAAAAPDAIAGRFMIATRLVPGRPARLSAAGQIVAGVRKNRGELGATSAAVMRSLASRMVARRRSRYSDSQSAFMQSQRRATGQHRYLST